MKPSERQLRTSVIRDPTKANQKGAVIPTRGRADRLAQAADSRRAEACFCRATRYEPRVLLRCW